MPGFFSSTLAPPSAITMISATRLFHWSGLVTRSFCARQGTQAGGRAVSLSARRHARTPGTRATLASVQPAAHDCMPHPQARNSPSIPARPRSRAARAGRTHSRRPPDRHLQPAASTSPRKPAARGLSSSPRLRAPPPRRRRRAIASASGARARGPSGQPAAYSWPVAAAQLSCSSGSSKASMQQHCSRASVVRSCTYYM